MSNAPTRHEAWFSVVEAYQTCNRLYEAMLQRFDLTVSQFDVLCAIEGLGADAQPKHIAERLVVTRGNVTGLLKGLVKRDLVTLHNHPEDGRARLCALTQRATQLMPQVRSAARRFIEVQLAPFSAQDLTHTHRLMTAMTQHLRTLNPAQLFDPASLGAQEKPA